MVKRAVREAEEKQSELRQQFPLVCLYINVLSNNIPYIIKLATAIMQQAAYEPALFYHQVNVQQMQSADVGGDEGDIPVHSGAQNRQIMPVAQPIFPSAILSVVPTIIEMFDDVQIDRHGACGEDFIKSKISNIIEKF